MGAICISNFIYISSWRAWNFLVCLSIWCMPCSAQEMSGSVRRIFIASPQYKTYRVNQFPSCARLKYAATEFQLSVCQETKTHRAAFSWADDLLLRKVVGSKKRMLYQRGGGWKMKTVCIWMRPRRLEEGEKKVSLLTPFDHKTKSLFFI